MKRDRNDVKKDVKLLLSNGIYCPREIFNRLYPTYVGHYSTLRNVIAEVKNES